MAVLAYEDELPVFRACYNINPIGVFQYVIFRYFFALRRFEYLASYGQPRTAAKITAVQDFPFAVVVIVLVFH